MLLFEEGIILKKIINDKTKVVDEMLEGMCKAHPEYVKRVEGFDVLIRSDNTKEKVVLISGGGSGHEPSHGGFVGFGMLDGAVAGAVFTSPTPDQIFEAIKQCDKGQGVLLIIKNYTGDLLNFDMAKEMAMCEDIKVESVVVNDDVAVENSTWTTGRRGICGTVFLHKIAGAMAELGGTLEDVKRVADYVVENTRSMGMAIHPCTVPEAGKPSFVLNDNEMEIGIGIHGEPGIKREKIKTCDEIVEELFTKIMAENIYNKGDEVAVIINGLGGTPLIELYIVANKLQDLLHDKGLINIKTYVGNYMTSLEMAGFSISMIKLNEEVKELLLKPANTPAFVQI